MIEEGGKALAAYLKPREEGQASRSDPATASPTSSRRSARSWNTGWPTRKRTVELQTQPRQGLSRSVGASTVTPHGGRAGAAGRHARPARQALRRSGMVVEPVLRLPQAGLSAHRPLGQPSRRRTPRASIRTRGTRPSSTCARSSTRRRRRTSSSPIRSCCARRSSSNAREPRARHAHAGRGHRGGRRRAARSASRIPRSSRSAATSRSRPAR